MIHCLPGKPGMIDQDLRTLCSILLKYALFSLFVIVITARFWYVS